MERNTTTTASKLKEGDRFYKANDRTKTVLQVVEHKAKKTHYQTYRYWYQAPGLMFAQPIKGNTVVIFLRNVNDEPKPNTTDPDCQLRPAPADCLHR